MTVGFTGTRRGMSEAQRVQCVLVLAWLSEPDGTVFVRDAVGADRTAARVAALQGYAVEAIPAGADPLARNRQIVAACDILVAAPETDVEQQRSGTWATVRYARAAGKPVVMLSRGRR